MAGVSCGSSLPPAAGGLGGWVREGSPLVRAVGAPAPRLLDRLREAIRVRHYRRRTAKAYVGWVRRFVLFHDKRHPQEMGSVEVSAFLSHLAAQARVSSSTQSQALSALLLVCAQVLNQGFGWLDDLVRANLPARVPVVLTREAVRAVLARLEGTVHLMVSLLYGAGLRLLECCRLRVKDVDLERGEIVVRDGKGARDRVTMLSVRLGPALAAQLEQVRAPHARDLGEGTGSVELPLELERKYPRALRDRLAVGVPGDAVLHGRCERPAPAAPSARIRAPAGHARGRAGRSHLEACQLPHASALVRDPAAGEWLRHPDDPGVARPPRCAHHHDLHPCAQPRQARREESARRGSG